MSGVQIPPGANPSKITCYCPMDFPSHLLWSALACKFVNRRWKRNLKLPRAVFWGVFPDLFAFLPGFLMIAVLLVSGALSASELPRSPREGGAQDDARFQILRTLYSFSHSIIIFAAAFFVARALLKRTPLEMGFWLFHILVDIPTHSFKFYPTPFLWPLSDYRFDGFTWWEPSFMITNYAAIAVAYLLLKKTEKKTAGTV